MLPLLPELIVTLSACWSMAFFHLFCVLYSILSVCQPKGGEPLDEDNDIFEMFQELMAKLDADDPDGRMRILSQNPRYAEDDEPAEKSITHKR